MMAFRQPKNLQDYLVRAKLRPVSNSDRGTKLKFSITFFYLFFVSFVFLSFLFVCLFFSAVFVLSSILLRTRAMFYLINEVCLLSRVQFAA